VGIGPGVAYSYHELMQQDQSFAVLLDMFLPMVVKHGDLA